MKSRLAVFFWGALVTVIAIPIIAAAMSPLLAWRQPIYIMAGFAGIIAMVLLLIQPLAIGGHLPNIPGPTRRRLHQWAGLVLVAMVLLHVAGLWITSPPDVIDALLFRSPTAFSAWGVIAMWSILFASIVAIFRRNLRLRASTWRITHTFLAAITVFGSIVHATQIVGTMEQLSKLLLCILVVFAMVKVFVDRQVWAKRKKS